MPKETILVIEDEKDVVNLLKYNLEKEGYGVLCAETGEKGLEIARSQKPDGVILDLMLPRMDGLEVCRLLKASRPTKHIPVLMLTAKSTDVDQVVGLELGASDYVTKPFSVKILLTRLKNVLRQRLKPSEESELLQCCELSLDRDRHILTVKDKKVDLTRTELGILTVFMENPQTVISREYLVSLVWGDGAYVSPAAVNMQIKSLRDKLGKCRDYIQTVRGSGFRFC